MTMKQHQRDPYYESMLVRNEPNPFSHKTSMDTAIIHISWKINRLDKLVLQLQYPYKSLHANTHLCGSLGSFFFLLFLDILGFFPLPAPVPEAAPMGDRSPVSGEGRLFWRRAFVSSLESSEPGEGEPPDAGDSLLPPGPAGVGW